MTTGSSARQPAVEISDPTLAFTDMIREHLEQQGPILDAMRDSTEEHLGGGKGPVLLYVVDIGIPTGDIASQGVSMNIVPVDRETLFSNDFAPLRTRFLELIEEVAQAIARDPGDAKYPVFVQAVLPATEASPRMAHTRVTFVARTLL